MKKVLKLLRNYAWISCTLLLFSSCTSMMSSVSKHPGRFTVNRPAMTETNEEAWRVYYDDQFDALEGAVPMPGNEYPEEAKLGYYSAKKYWDNRVRQTQALNEGSKGLMIAGIGIVALIALFAFTPTAFLY